MGKVTFIDSKIAKGIMEMEKAKAELASARKLAKACFDNDQSIASVTTALKSVAFWDGYLTAYEEIQKKIQEA